MSDGRNWGLFLLTCSQRFSPSLCMPKSKKGGIFFGKLSFLLKYARRRLCHAVKENWWRSSDKSVSVRHGEEGKHIYITEKVCVSRWRRVVSLALYGGCMVKMWDDWKGIKQLYFFDKRSYFFTFCVSNFLGEFLLTISFLEDHLLTPPSESKLSNRPSTCLFGVWRVCACVYAHSTELRDWFILSPSFVRFNSHLEHTMYFHLYGTIIWHRCQKILQRALSLITSWIFSFSLSPTHIISSSSSLATYMHIFSSVSIISSPFLPFCDEHIAWH